MAETSMNDDLQELHGLLVAQAQTLGDRLGEAETVDEAKAIQGEITEVNHRVNLVGNLLFTQQTAGITKAMDKVRNAQKDLEKATAEIEQITSFLKTMTSFLTLVDKVIDTAKMLAPVAGL